MIAAFNVLEFGAVHPVKGAPGMRGSGPAAVAGHHRPRLAFRFAIACAFALLPARAGAQVTVQPPAPPPPEAPKPPEEKKIDTIGVPQAEPPPVQPPAPETAPLPPATVPPE